MCNPIQRYIPISLLLESSPPPPTPAPRSKNPKVRLERLTPSLTGSVARSKLYYLKQRREYSMNNSSFADVTNNGLILWLALLGLAFIPVLRYLDTRGGVPANRVGWFVK